MKNTSPISEFENIIDTIQGKSNKSCDIKNNGKVTKNTTKTSTMPKSDIIFETLIEQNNLLNVSMQRVTKDICEIRDNHEDSFSKNLTFALVFSALEVAVKEYEYQSQLFEEYSSLYDEMCNEENIVKVLDLLRLIITDRRAILNDIMSNILKIQKLDNDRIKMDNSINDGEDDLDDMISPDTL
jgi:hypothetical protein